MYLGLLELGVYVCLRSEGGEAGSNLCSSLCREAVLRCSVSCNNLLVLISLLTLLRPTWLRHILHEAFSDLLKSA